MLLPFLVLVATGAVLAAPDGAAMDVLPDFFPKSSCHRNDNVCIKRQMQEFLGVLKKGGRSDLPRFDPYLVEQQLSSDFKSGPADFEVLLKNVTVSGFPDIVIHDVRSAMKPDSMTMDVDLTIPKMVFRGNFKIGGKLSSYEFTGHGPFDISFNEINASWRVHGERQRGSKYMSIKSVTPSYTVGGMHISAKGLVDGSPDINDLILLLMNRLWPEVVAVGKPFAQKPIADQLRVIVNSFFKKYPYEVLFLPQDTPMAVSYS